MTPCPSKTHGTLIWVPANQARAYGALLLRMRDGGCCDGMRDVDMLQQDNISAIISLPHQELVSNCGHR